MGAVILADSDARGRIMSVWEWLLNPAGLTAHGFCLSWAPGLVALHAASDAIIGLAYFSAPVALIYFVRQRRDLQYGWVFYLFIAFILACGATHLMAIVTLWIPVYGIEGVIKAITAMASLVTAIILWSMIPKLIDLPSPAQLERVNQDLNANIAEKERACASLEDGEARIRAINIDLEKRIAEKTAELTASNCKLATSLEHRDTLIREVYHRVKNNLQTIDALIAVQSRRLTDDTARKGLHDLRQRVYALGLVHQQLMDSNDLKTFDIAPFLENLTHNLVEAGFQPGVKMTVQSIPLAVGFDFAIPLGLLVTELVTNSLKHAFPDGVGQITVVLERNQDEKLTLIVSDNGKGLTSAESFPYGTSPGRGINIITGLVNQLKGSLAMSGENGTHTEIYLAAPVTA
jgi:two-component sensor histidine kinase